MRIQLTHAAVGAMIASLAVLTAAPAAAKCTRLGFSVNDYGKDGPTKDAKELLDKYIARWTAEQGIKKYTTGKKDVNCELFLDVILFDEYTCKAEATVCWNEGPQAPQEAGVQPAPVQKPDQKKLATPPKPADAPASDAAVVGTPVAPTPPAATAAPETAPSVEPPVQPAYNPPRAETAKTPPETTGSVTTGPPATPEDKPETPAVQQ